MSEYVLGNIDIDYRRAAKLLAVGVSAAIAAGGLMAGCETTTGGGGGGGDWGGNQGGGFRGGRSDNNNTQGRGAGGRVEFGAIPAPSYTLAPGEAPSIYGGAPVVVHIPPAALVGAAERPL